jgi:hypothetical protein
MKYGPKAQRKYDAVYKALSRAGRTDAQAATAAKAACQKTHDMEEQGDWRDRIDRMEME